MRNGRARASVAESPARGELRRSNLLGIWRSSNPDAPWFAVDSHLDTVMVVGMEPHEPFGGDLTPDGCVKKPRFIISFFFFQNLFYKMFC